MVTPREEGPTDSKPKIETVSPVLKTATILCLGVAIVSLAVERLDVIAGFALGTLFSMLNFLLMKRDIVRRFGMSPKRAGVDAFFSMVLRYALLGVPLFIAIKVPVVNIPAACVGIFNIQISILLYYLLWQTLIQRKEFSF